MNRLAAVSVMALFVSMTSVLAQSSLVTFTIDGTYPGSVPAAGGAGVFSDATNTGTDTYSDYRIDPNPYLNWCVDAQPGSAGNLFVRLNRKLDGDAGSLRCSENPRPDGAFGVPREFVLKIANDAACDILADPLAGLPLTDAYGNPWNTSGSLTPCVLLQSDNPRIRLGTLYKARPRTTSVDFLTVMFDYPNSYEIRSETEATITQNALDPARRSVAYSGTFRLVKFAPDAKAKTVGPSFMMPVRMEFLQQ
jgi:hypothetical protein